MGVGEEPQNSAASIGPRRLQQLSQIANKGQEPQRLPVVEKGRLVGIVAQADIALRENEKKTGGLVVAISEPSEEERR